MKYFLVTSILFISSFSVANPIEYKCNYNTYSAQDGIHNTKDNFNITFTFDSSTNKAYMSGNIGINDVYYIGRPDGRTFIEVTDGGNVMTTTIDNKLLTVHSRNTIINGDIVPSQYYGKCTERR